MALSKENIQFIDQYLKKSEVVFDDLRLELVDHTATAVSFKMINENLDFYDAFKDFMVENKKEILKAGMVNQIVNLKLIGSKFFSFLMLKEIVVLSVIFIFLAVNNFQVFLLENLKSFQTAILSSIIIFTVIWAIVFYGILRKRFFILENNTFLLAILYQLFNLSRFFWDDNLQFEFYSSLTIGFLIVLCMVFMCKSAIEFYSKNKSLYATE